MMQGGVYQDGGEGEPGEDANLGGLNDYADSKGPLA